MNPEKLKFHDRLLLYLPTFAILLVNLVLFGGIQTVNYFQARFAEETDAALMQKAQLTTTHVSELLRAGNLHEAEAFCRSFDNRIFRLTLIAQDGRVLADSLSDRDGFDNHAGRAEVKSVLEGKPMAFSRRYSGTMKQTMLYCATAVASGGKTYALRMAVPVSSYERLADSVVLCISALMAVSALLLLVLQIYLIRKVYTPLAQLQKGARTILSGDTAAAIPVPPSGVVRELALDVSDMTEQLKLRLSEITRERNEKNSLLETMSEGVLLFDAAGVLLRRNAEAAEIFGIAPDAPFQLGRCRIPELLDASDHALETGEPFEKEFTLVENGATRSLLIKGRVLAEEGAKRLLLSVTDLTGLHRLESFRSDFVANVSHEIKTPLTCIVGAVEVLEEDPEAPAEQRKTLLTMLKSQAKRLNNLVRDILSLSALEKQQLDNDGDFPVVELDSVVANAVNLCRPRAEEAKIALDIKWSEPIACPADCQLIEQALVNLIVNAVKYSGSPRIEVSLFRENGDAVLEVRDYGIGIAPAHAKRIFERFYRVDKSRSRELGGTGLGLAIVKHIAQLHHGRAELLTSPGNGCAFRIVIPPADAK